MFRGLDANGRKVPHLHDRRAGGLNPNQTDGCILQFPLSNIGGIVKSGLDAEPGQRIAREAPDRWVDRIRKKHGIPTAYEGEDRRCDRHQSKRHEQRVGTALSSVSFA